MASGHPGSTTHRILYENGPENMCHVMYNNYFHDLLWPVLRPWPVLSLSYTNSCSTFTIPLGTCIRNWARYLRLWMPAPRARLNVNMLHFAPLTWPWPDTWPRILNFKSALGSDLVERLSNAASPVSLTSIRSEVSQGGGRYHAPTR